VVHYGGNSLVHILGNSTSCLRRLDEAANPRLQIEDENVEPESWQIATFELFYGVGTLSENQVSAV
jgi:hypothetical protein